MTTLAYNNVFMKICQYGGLFAPSGTTFVHDSNDPNRNDLLLPSQFILHRTDATGIDKIILSGDYETDEFPSMTYIYQLGMHIYIPCRDALADSGVFDSQMSMPHDILSSQCCDNKWMNNRLLSSPNSRNNYSCLRTECVIMHNDDPYEILCHELDKQYIWYAAVHHKTDGKKLLFKNVYNICNTRKFF